MKMFTFLFTSFFILCQFCATSQTVTSISEDEPYSIAEVMPLFPGCPENENVSEQKKCAEKKMLEFIYHNIKYPAEARTKGIEGIAVVSFIVEKDGAVTNPKMLRKIGGGCDEEVLRVVSSFPKWIPGSHEGEYVRVQFNMPVRFKLQDQPEYTVIDTINSETIKSLTPSYNNIQSLFCADYTGEFVEAEVLNQIADEPMATDSPCGFLFVMSELKISYEIDGKLTELSSKEGLTPEMRDIFRNAKAGASINLNYVLERDGMTSEQARVIIVPQ